MPGRLTSVNTTRGVRLAGELQSHFAVGRLAHHFNIFVERHAIAQALAEYLMIVNNQDCNFGQIYTCSIA